MLFGKVLSSIFGSAEKETREPSEEAHYDDDKHKEEMQVSQPSPAEQHASFTEQNGQENRENRDMPLKTNTVDSQNLDAMKAVDLKRLCKQRNIPIKGSETKAVLKQLILDSADGSSSPVIVDIRISTSNSALPSPSTTPMSAASAKPKLPPLRGPYNTRRSSLTPVPSEPTPHKKSPAKKTARKEEKQEGRGSTKRQKGLRAASPVVTPSGSAPSPIVSISSRLSAGGKKNGEKSSPQRSSIVQSSPSTSSKPAATSDSALSVRKTSASSHQTSQSTHDAQQRSPDQSTNVQPASSEPVFTLSSEPSQSALNTEESDSDAFESVHSESLAPAATNQNGSQNAHKSEEMEMADDIIELLDSDDDVPGAQSEARNADNDGGSQVSSMHETVGSALPTSEASLAVQAFSKLGSKLLSASATAESESMRSASNMSLSEREYELLKMMLEKVKPPTVQTHNPLASAVAPSAVQSSAQEKTASPVVSRLSFLLPPPPPPSASSHFTLESATKASSSRLSFEGAPWTSRDSFMPTLTEVTPVKPVASTLFGGESRLAERLPTPYHRATASELKKRALEDMDDNGDNESTPFRKKELITTSQGANVSRGRFSFSFNSHFMAPPTSVTTPTFSLGANENSSQAGMSYIQRRRLQKQSTPSAPPSSETAKRILEALSELKAPKEPLVVAEPVAKPLPQIPIKPVSSIPVPAPPRVSFLVANSDQIVEKPNQPRVTFDSNRTTQPALAAPASTEKKQDEKKALSKEPSLAPQAASKSVRFEESPASTQDGEFSFEEPEAIEDLDDVREEVTQMNNFIKYTFSPGSKKRRQEDEVGQSAGAPVKKAAADAGGKEINATKKQESAPSAGINIWAASSINDGIKCNVCLVRNKSNATRCVSCESPLTSNSSAPAVQRPAESKSLGGQPAEVPNIWAKAASTDTIKCQACYVPNKKGATKCVACESALGSTTTDSKAASGNAPEAKKDISWSSTAPPSNSAITSNAFTFAPPAVTSTAAGPNSTSEGKSSGFTFGSAPASAAEGAKPAPFTFGVPAATPVPTAAPTAAAFTFGALPAPAATSAPATSAPASGFSFGVPPSVASAKASNEDDDSGRRKKRRDFDDDDENAAKGKKAVDLPPATSFSSATLPAFNTNVGDKQEKSEPKPAFSFSLPVAQPASESTSTTAAPSSSFGSTSSAAFAAPAPAASAFNASGFTFGTSAPKDAKAEDSKPKETPAITLSIPSSAATASTASASFTFGAPASKTVSFGKTEEPSASAAFSTTAPSAPVATPATTTSAPPPFSFGGSAVPSVPPAATAEPKPFTFGAPATTTSVAPSGGASDAVKSSVTFAAGAGDKPGSAPAPFAFGASNSTPAAPLTGSQFGTASNPKADAAPKPFAFGAPQAAPTALFGAAPASSSQPANSVGFALGSTAKVADIMSPGMDMGGANSTATAPIISSAPFGNSFVAAPSGQMFGAPSSTAPTSAGPFGALTSAPPSNPFGSTASNPFASAAPAQGGGLFGSSTAVAPTSSNTGGLFGAAHAPAAPAVFGGFGTSNTAPVVSNPFGGGAAAPASASMFGAAPVVAPSPSPAFNSAPFAFGSAAPSAPSGNVFGALSSNNSSNSLNSGFPAIPGSAFGAAPAGGGFSLGAADKGGEQRRKVKAKRPGT